MSGLAHQHRDRRGCERRQDGSCDPNPHLHLFLPASAHCALTGPACGDPSQPELPRLQDPRTGGFRVPGFTSPTRCAPVLVTGKPGHHELAAAIELRAGPATA
jgi:hypothetical protein